MVSPRKKLRTVRGLNRLASAFPGLVNQREVPRVQPLNSRDKDMVRILDIILMLQKLLNIRKKRTVHLALDLYLILLCSQRYLADRNKIKQGVLGMLQRNRDRG